MTYFLIAAQCVGIMLIFAVPGFLFTKFKKIKAESISAFAKYLMFVCQPCLTVYSFQTAIPHYSSKLLINMGWVAVLGIVLELVILGISYLAIGKKREDVRYRIMTVSTVLGNVGFLGVPLLEAMLPNNPEVIVYSAVFSSVMFLIVWSLGAFVITQDIKCIKPKNIILNPTLLALCVALPLFFTRTILPDILSLNVMILARATTPLCMVILGLRLGTLEKPSVLFNDWRVFVASAVKLVGMPLFTMLILYFTPLELAVKQAVFILACCPCASMVLNLAELYSVGQESASKNVLACTVFSIATIPLLALMLPLFG